MIGIFHLSPNLKTVYIYVIIFSFSIDYFCKLRSLMQYSSFPPTEDGISLISAFVR